MTSPSRWLRTKAAAAYLGVHEKTLWRYAREVDGFPRPFRPFAPTIVMWDATEIDAFMERRRDAERARGPA